VEFDDGAVNTEETGVGWKRRKRAHGQLMGVKPEESDNGRHKAFLGNHSRKFSKRAPIYRISSKKEIAALDNQIRVSSDKEGLRFYAYNEDDPVWAKSNWRNWPHMNFAQDLGPNILCATNALIFHFLVNMMRTPDFDHGIQRAFLGACSAADMKNFLLLMTISFNVPCSWDQTDLRFKQILDATDQIFLRYSARSMAPLIG
jgi:hypothetical protein